jgi:MFS family permease
MPNLLNIILGASAMGLFAFIPLYAASAHKLSTLMSGMILTPRSIGAISASAVTSFLLRRCGYRRPIIVGLSLVAICMVLLAPGWSWEPLGTRFGVVEILLFLILLTGVGMGIMFPAANNACIELAPERVASIVGLRGMFRTVGGALGVSSITFILHVKRQSRRWIQSRFHHFRSCALLRNSPCLSHAEREETKDRLLTSALTRSILKNKPHGKELACRETLFSRHPRDRLQLRETKMQPALERALKHRENLKA